MWNRSGNAKPLLVISAYWDGLKNTMPEALVETINYARDKQLQFIIGIDANAHSTTWGSSQDNTRGKIMELFIASNNMEIHNKQNNPTFQTFREGRLIQSTIDLTLTSNLYDTPISEWNTSYSFEGSDHRMIHFTITKPKGEHKMVYNFSKCSWQTFHNELNEMQYPELATEWTHKTIDKEANFIKQTITDALNKHCPKIPATTRIKMGWWSNELQKMKHKVAVARRLATNTQLNEHIEEFLSIQRLH
jgi:hypothetical protein